MQFSNTGSLLVTLQVKLKLWLPFILWKHSIIYSSQTNFESDNLHVHGEEFVFRTQHFESSLSFLGQQIEMIFALCVSLFQHVLVATGDAGNKLGKMKYLLVFFCFRLLGRKLLCCFKPCIFENKLLQASSSQFRF